MNLNCFSCQLPHIADISQIAREYHYGEWAGVMVFAEIEKMYAFVALTNFQNLANHTASFTNVILCFMNR